MDGGERRFADELPALYRLGGIAAFLQLLTLLLFFLVPGSGITPDGVEEYLGLFGQGSLFGLLHSDLSSVILIAFYLFTFPALYFA